ncbi:nuclear receptor 2c2-associated protein-like [Plakobranchus ocellatus]|uniref:Nuclear receptor 2C2-associated protein n=1 Tax=Plakobranchus ocellatus TaxID=259542 RepID=A0AAV4DQM6_9GAST|nr:nuclear receptor 2c2-associated protein-like [Plakobranchus ocellatus]
MAAPITSLTDKISRTRVSSVLNKDTKQFGKKHLFDGDDETCWNSDQGSPQWILVDFSEAVTVSQIEIQFQGGFVGKTCWIEAMQAGQENLSRLHEFFPQDVNQTQVFPLPEPALTLTSLKLVFDSSTDFFGRITIYKLDLLGSS